MPLIPAIGRQRQADLHESKTSLVYKGNSRTARTITQRKSIVGGKKLGILTTLSLALEDKVYVLE